MLLVVVKRSTRKCRKNLSWLVYLFLTIVSHFEEYWDCKRFGTLDGKSHRIFSVDKLINFGIRYAQKIVTLSECCLTKERKFGSGHNCFSFHDCCWKTPIVFWHYFYQVKCVSGAWNMYKGLQWQSEQISKCFFYRQNSYRLRTNETSFHSGSVHVRIDELSEKVFCFERYPISLGEQLIKKKN